MAPVLNQNWLNRTPNKTVRAAGQSWKFLVYHETASPNPDNPVGTLNYNLRADIESSYHYLIARDGVIYVYLDPERYIAWHAGVGSAALGYSGWFVNVNSIGIEYDGNNLGVPITQAQRDSGAWLTQQLCQRYRIPLEAKYHLRHGTVAPGYKTDPKGFDPLHIMEAAKALNAITPAPVSSPADVQVIGVPQAITASRAIDAFKLRGAPLSSSESERIYTMSSWLDMDIRFLIAVAQHESGKPLGGSPLQKLSNCPINIRAATGEWRPQVKHPTRGDMWLAFESYQLGCMQSLIHLKNVHGAAGRLTVKMILPVHAPASDGNSPDTFIRSVLENMRSM